MLYEVQIVLHTFLRGKLVRTDDIVKDVTEDELKMLGPTVRVISSYAEKTKNSSSSPPGSGSKVEKEK